MARDTFKFPMDYDENKNPPRQIHGVTTLRKLQFLQNALTEVQDRIEALEEYVKSRERKTVKAEKIAKAYGASDKKAKEIAKEK